MTPTFRGGHNIAMKLPKAQFDHTIAFYRDILGMAVTDESGAAVAGIVAQSASVQLGPVTLWFDRVDNYARADLWLELFTDDVDQAARHLAAHGVAVQDELEPFPPGMNAHWISNPVGIPHIVRRPEPDQDRGPS
ncbi:glyoxalase/bleomycin resistance protein/dioxygenase superfamily protein [Murinocardiopsis flavida]|uniref:Glyoxalase/bleomycin resistance protein/dioxygenase superfamily protein n=1 Tax=Murinocardiopsis flavida TaxID=645275 RepID=A0A2P8D8S9_9ACTN|nr:VOC family protein [Murinocardiopsis flavida]PSK93636.1 glyoxalase/bleomycin resistance protein/dioxygenase superfamily protein [Murinocardiopsis flavida]